MLMAKVCCASAQSMLDVRKINTPAHALEDVGWPGRSVSVNKRSTVDHSGGTKTTLSCVVHNIWLCVYSVCCI